MVTPRKLYFLKDVCAICGFSFIQKQKMSDRSEKLMKHSNKKLSLTEDKLKLVADVLKDNFSELDLTVSQHSICVTCFR